MKNPGTLIEVVKGSSLSAQPDQRVKDYRKESSLGLPESLSLSLLSWSQKWSNWTSLTDFDRWTSWCPGGFHRRLGLEEATSPRPRGDGKASMRNSSARRRPGRRSLRPRGRPVQSGTEKKDREKRWVSLDSPPCHRVGACTVRTHKDTISYLRVYLKNCKHIDVHRSIGAFRHHCPTTLACMAWRALHGPGVLQTARSWSVLPTDARNDVQMFQDQVLSSADGCSADGRTGSVRSPSGPRLGRPGRGPVRVRTPREPCKHWDDHL